MTELRRNQQGFIPMLLTIIFMVLVGIFMVYVRVRHAHQQ